MLQGRAEILIVDNDARIVELVAWFLKKRGFEVRSAATFVEAHEHLARWRPDLMLSDIDLGSESALEELPRLEAAGLLPPTLVVSGFLDPRSQAQLGRLGPVLDTLAKPFDFAVLEERVRACLSRVAAGDVPTPARPTRQGVGEDDEGWIEITPAPKPGQHV